MKQKQRIMILRLESCGGCMSQLLNSPNLLGMMENIDFDFIENSSLEKEKAGYLFVEGFIATPEEKKLFEESARKAKNIVLFGSCASDASYFLRNPEVIKYPDSIEAKTILLGCPPSNEEIENLITSILLNLPLKKPNYPVCDDCGKNEIKCLLKSGIECLGAQTFGQCKILCPRIGKGCISCRTNLKSVE